MTAAEVRGTAQAYFRIRELLYQPLTEDTKVRFTEFLRWCEDQCRGVTNTSAPARWARSVVGPVLAAAVGGAISGSMRDLASPNAALKIFSLAGDRPLSPEVAWKLVQPYASGRYLSDEAFAEIRRKSGLRLSVSSQNPSVLDVLEELTRARAGGFPAQVGHWLAEHFRANSCNGNPYGPAYQTALADLLSVNDRGEVFPAVFIHASMDRSDWDAFLQGRVTKDRLELRAGYAVARQFIAEYWAKWQTRAK